MSITEDPAPLEAPREWTPSNRGPPAAGGGSAYHLHADLDDHLHGDRDDHLHGDCGDHLHADLDVIR